MSVHAGGCHCGNLRYELTTALALKDLPLRACQCSFCRRHGALSTSDPKGALRISTREPRLLTRYRFGLKTADFLICARCGSYIGALIDDAGERFAVINANTLDEAARLGTDVVSFSYDGESPEQRRARRRERWTPVTRS